MTIDLLLVQFLVLAFTGALWWLARRDLTARAAPPPPASAEMPELEPLLATLETVVTDLARRLERVERQLAEETPLSRNVGGRFLAPSELAMAAKEGAMNRAPTPVASEPDAAPQEARYAPVYALLDEGVTDPQDIARRTGLSRGEVDLILSLRARRAL